MNLKNILYSIFILMLYCDYTICQVNYNYDALGNRITNYSSGNSPTIKISSIKPCSGSTIIATLSGGVNPYSYQWNTGSTTNKTFALANGKETKVSITDAQGCISKASVISNDEDCFGAGCTGDPIIVADNPIPDLTYLSQQTIVSSGVVESGNQVRFIAAQSITLEAGFHAKLASDFLAKIEDCQPVNFVTDLPLEDRMTGEQETANIPEDGSRIANSNIEVKIGPNPFCYSTTIEVSRQTNTPIQIMVYDIAGNPIKNLARENPSTLLHQTFTLSSTGLIAGNYYLVVQSGQMVISKKVMYISK